MAEMALLTGIGAATGGQIMGGLADRQSARLQTAAAKRNAVAAEQAGELQSQRVNVDRRRRMSATRAAFGAAGITGAGSPLEVLTDQAVEADLDRRLARQAGQVSGQEQRLRASQFRQAGRGAMVGAGARAGRTILTGFSDFKESGGKLSDFWPGFN